MRFSLRTLLLITLVFALCITAYVHIADERERRRRLTDTHRWPRPIQAIVKVSPDITDSIRVYDLQGFLDETKLVAISGRPEAVAQIINEFRLLKTDKTHPYAKQLLESLPKDWRKPQPSYVWYTSPGFGSVHQEGVDLFLIAVEPIRGDAVILYNWIF